MQIIKIMLLYTAILGAAALFGFYFTMSVSIMPGFDLTDPYAAIIANQDIGAATQQSAFFVALLGTPIALLAAIILYWRQTVQRNFLLLGMAGWIGMFVVTLALNVPLNSILVGLTVEAGQSNLADLWAAYSVDWQKWNWLRLLASGISLVFIAAALHKQPYIA